MKPPVPYFGGKQGLAPWIVSLLPPHEHYVEPYCGSLAVLLAKRPSRYETVNDLDAELINFWQVLRDRPDELIRACHLTPHSRAESDLSYKPAEDELEAARRVFVRLTQGVGGHLRKSTWRYKIDPCGQGMAMPQYLDNFRDRLAPAAERLMRVSLESRPALDVIRRYGKEPPALLYTDPPYLGSSRAASSRYRLDMTTDDEHRELAEALNACRAAVVLSGYDSPLYAELYEGWHRYTAATWTGNAKGDMSRTEVLWSNRELGAQGVLDFGEAS